jgi:hypothetical protein
MKQERELQDNLLLSDGDENLIERTLSETLKLEDGDTSIISRTLTDSINLSSVLLKSISTELEETLSLSDVYDSIWELSRTLVETLKLTDNISKTDGKVIKNIIYMSDFASSNQITKLLSTTLTLDTGDDRNINKLCAETLELVDDFDYTWSLERTLSDVIELVDWNETRKWEDYDTTLTEDLILDDAEEISSYGQEGFVNVYIFDPLDNTWKEIEGVEYFKVTKRLNQISKFEMDFPYLETAQKVYIKEFARVMLVSGTNLVLKGRIQKVTYQTTDSAKIEGFGMEAVILDREYRNTTRSPDDPERVQYTNVSAQTIANELLSVNADGIFPWTMTPALTGIFATDYGPMTIRYEYANNLTALANLSDAINYDWWVDHTPTTHSQDFFNMAEIKGDQTTPGAERTFNITGPLVNCERTDYERDVQNIANYINVVGYGDGINQLSTITFNASPIYSLLAENVVVGATTISLLDASAFASSGTIRIADEIVTYTGKTANDLTGVSGIEEEHKKGCYVEKYVAFTSPEVGSSIEEYGVKDMTFTHKEVRDKPLLELIASNELLDRMHPIERMTLHPTDPEAVVENIETGDLVTINDAESGIIGDYRIMSITYENHYGMLSVELEASNKSLAFIEQMQKERERNQSLQKYMQGSTNIYSVQSYENCDDTIPLNLRWFLPQDLLAINDTRLSFKLKPFRAYSAEGETSVASEISRIASAATINANQTIQFTDSWKTMISITTGSEDCEGVFLNFNAIPTLDANSAPSSSTLDWMWRIVEGANYYPTSAGTDFTGGILWNDQPSIAVNVSQYVPGNQKSKTFSLQMRQMANLGRWTFNLGATYSTFTRHTHDINFGIFEEPLVSPSVEVWIGEDGGVMTLFGTYTSDQENLDITDAVLGIGVEKWVNVQFTPNKRMRLEANIYNKVFIES